MSATLLRLLDALEVELKHQTRNGRLSREDVRMGVGTRPGTLVNKL